MGMPRKRLRVVAALAAAAIALLGGAVWLVGSGRVSITSTSRPEDRCAIDIPAVPAGSDRDGDGIDDGEDVLASALAYVGTRPRYRSAYYAGGYPDDGCGVCTDVVAFALRGAGYDLMELVAKDEADAPGAYGDAAPDPAIDFRRVRNLQVFFSRHAESLRTDVGDVDSWQGGDIVVFEGHIGVVSDRRNADGVPYVIHHEGPFQLSYEEDILSGRQGSIVGHYRVSEIGRAHV